jgi:hypothetical protein
LRQWGLSIPSFALTGIQHIINCADGRILLFVPTGAQHTIVRASGRSAFHH